MIATYSGPSQGRRAGRWGTLTLAIWLAGCGTTAPVSPPSQPLETASQRPSPPGQTVAVGRLRVEFGGAPDIDLTVESRNGVVGFGDGLPGLSYGAVGQGPYGQLKDARGVVIADVTGATFHAGPTTRGENAADFLANMSALRRMDGSQGYVVGPITTATFAGFPALAAEVSAKHSYPFLEMGEASHVVYLGMPQRLIVADVDEAILLIQVWAATDAGLNAWLPTATSLTESMRVAGSP